MKRTDLFFLHKASRRAIRFLAGMLGLVLPGLTLAALPPPLVDGFVDGSGRHAPAVVVIPQLTREVGAQAFERGYSNSELTHTVHLSLFAIGRTEITNAEFVQFLNEAGSRDSNDIPWFDAAATGQILERDRVFSVAPGMESRPVAGVSWRGARAYAKWLSQKTGATYDLPTGVQWEVAARAGTRTTWWWGNHDDVSRYHGIASGTPESADVRTYGPNPWGIYDTSGNVWEWMRDCYAADAPLLALPDDPLIFDERCRLPEIRGGSFRDGGQYSRPAYRSDAYAGTMVDALGFRVVRNIDPKPVQMAAGDFRPVALQWLHGGAPASGLIVVESRAGSVHVQWIGAGQMQLALADSASVHVYDSVSGLKLFEGPVTASTLKLPEPVWVTGQIRAAGQRVTNEGLRVRMGSGSRTAPMERWLAATGSGAPRDDRMTQILGVPLPASPSVWSDATLNGNEFDSGWILADDAPQVVAFDAAGRVAVQDIVLPAQITPHARLYAGTLRLRATSSLTVSAKLPAGDLPMPVLLGIRSVKVDAAKLAETGRLLSALDQIDANLFDFLVLDHGISLSYRGQLRLAPLPPFRAVTLMVHEPFKSEGTERQVALQAGKPAMLTLVPIRTATAKGAASYRSRVVREDGTPVADADVVVVDYPRRFTIRTDADGRFSVDGVGSGSLLTVLVDASRAGQRLRGPSTKIFRDVRPGDGSPLVLPEPEFVSRTSQQQSPPAAPPTDLLGKCTPYNDPQYGLQSWLAFNGNASSDQFEASFDISTYTINATICKASDDWTFFFAPTPFAMFHGATKGVTGKSDGENCPSTCSMGCTSYAIPAVKTDMLKQLTLSVVNSNGFAVTGAQLYFSPPSPFSLLLEPTPLITDLKGQITFCNINTNPMHIFYQGAQGYTDSDQDLSNGLLRLGPASGDAQKATP